MHCFRTTTTLAPPTHWRHQRERTGELVSQVKRRLIGNWVLLPQLMFTKIDIEQQFKIVNMHIKVCIKAAPAD